MVYVFGFFLVEIVYFISENEGFKIDLYNGIVLVNFMVDCEINEFFFLIVIL